MKNYYGCIGFVSLLGFLGLLGEPIFYSFFAFIVFFEYFAVKPDEMFLDTMKKCAALAFFSNLLVTVCTAFALFYFQISSNPLAAGAAFGFGVSIAAFAFSASFFQFREMLNVQND